jgi:hypothetical protein
MHVFEDHQMHEEEHHGKSQNRHCLDHPATDLSPFTSIVLNFQVRNEIKNVTLTNRF